MKTNSLKVRITTMEELLGTASANPEIHEKYIASKGPNAQTIEEEVEALGPDEVVRDAMTIFPKVGGNPILWDYQIKGFFKDACGVLRKVQGSCSSKLKAYKKDIDGLIFVKPRAIEIKFEGQIGSCQRPLRASTPQGERIAIANSETIPAGAVIEFEIHSLTEDHEDLIREWLDYGELRGLGQWRNSGKGRFTYEIIS